MKQAPGFEPTIQPSATAPFVRVQGRFFRSVDLRHAASALRGSTADGRYSTAGQATLYLSATPEGVEAAMQAHVTATTPPRIVLELEVDADRIFDLRASAACAAAGVSLAEAMAPWQEALLEGRRPPSWGVASRLRAIGASGLIDPSRKAPGLWHLALFAWNGPGLPRVSLSGAGRDPQGPCGTAQPL